VATHRSRPGSAALHPMDDESLLDAAAAAERNEFLARSAA